MIEIIPQNQPNDYGCLLTCLAMVRGVQYRLVENDFENIEHITMIMASNYLADFGYTVLIKEMLSWSHPNDGRTFMLNPFAEAHILQVFCGTDSTVAHALVMDGSGKIINPDRNSSRKIEDYFRISVCLGIWSK